MTWDELRRELGKVEKPARYTGGEVGAVRKDWAAADVRFALAFPDTYEVGASHLGSHILYSVLNSLDYALCERAYAPWFDMEALLREKGWPLYTLESFKPLRDFDIVGFSLQYELTYTNVLAMLDLGCIPLRSADRSDTDPLVIAGGPCAMAPEPLADFIDAFALGDGEELAVDIVNVYREWSKAKAPRIDLLKMLSQVEGVYVPSLYHVEYAPVNSAPEGMAVAAVTPRNIGGFVAPKTVKRRVLKSLEGAPFPDKPLIPLIAPIHDRAMVEIFRGCSQGCRFCQAGMLYRPVRERDPETVDRLARDILERSGYDEVSLVSLSSADYTYIKDAVAKLLTENPCGARVSLPSLRVDSFSVGLAEMLGSSSSSGLTLAPEAGSQRMRDAINKRVTEPEILDAAERAFSAGYSHIKLYFMIGLPGETDDDVRAIASLAARVRQIGRDKGKKPTVVVSVSGFVPKPNTPFQWEPAELPDELKRKQRLLRSRLRGPGLDFKYHDADLTQLEAVFARGDRRLGAALESAFRKGRRFDAWTERQDLGAWRDAFLDAGVDPEFFAHRERSKDEVFPWDHLSAGVRKAYLWREREKSLESLVTGDCREGRCTGCGICPDYGVEVRLAGGRVVSPSSSGTAGSESEGTVL
ncbi:MAG: TIGR03960 family B12-binding radical SAM protein [Bacillota bacterium]